MDSTLLAILGLIFASNGFWSFLVFKLQKKEKKDDSMKEGIHPNYQPVVFVDANTGKEYITRSTKSSAEKKTIDGVEYSVISLEITADTHPFWTGKQHRVDTAGRIDRFNKRFAGNITGAKRKTRKAAPAKAEDAE